MKVTTLVLLLALVGSAALISVADAVDGEIIDDEDDEYEDVELDENRAILIAHKYIKEATVIQGGNMTIQIDLHNVGKGTATNVQVTDVEIDSSIFKLVEGSTKVSFEKITPGSTVRHSYVVVPKRGDLKFFGESAHVKFSAFIEGPASQELLSTTAYAFVLTTFQSLQVQALKLGRVISLGMLKTPGEWVNSLVVITLSALVFGANSLARWYIVTKDDRKRAKARAELGDH